MRLRETTSPAAEKYERILRILPNVAGAHENQGVVYYQQGLTAQASVSLKKAIELNPELSGPLFFLGLISYKAREYQDVPCPAA